MNKNINQETKNQENGIDTIYQKENSISRAVKDTKNQVENLTEDFSEAKKIILNIFKEQKIEDLYSLKKNLPTYRFMYLLSEKNLWEQNAKIVEKYVFSLIKGKTKSQSISHQDMRNIAKDVGLIEYSEEEQKSKFFDLLKKNLLDAKNLTYEKFIKKSPIWDHTCTQYVIEKALWYNRWRNTFKEEDFLDFYLYINWKIQAKDYKTEKFKETARWKREILSSLKTREIWKNFTDFFKQNWFETYYDFYFSNVANFKDLLSKNPELEQFYCDVTCQSINKISHYFMLVFAQRIWYEEYETKELKKELLDFLVKNLDFLDDESSNLEDFYKMIHLNNKVRYCLQVTLKKDITSLKKDNFKKIISRLKRSLKLSEEDKKEKLEKNVKQFLASKWLKYIDDLPYFTKAEFLEFFEDDSFKNYLKLFWIRKTNFSIKKALDLTNNFGLTKMSDDK